MLHLNLYTNLNSRFRFSGVQTFYIFGTFSVSGAEQPSMKTFYTFYCCLKFKLCLWSGRKVPLLHMEQSFYTLICCLPGEDWLCWSEAGCSRVCVSLHGCTLKTDRLLNIYTRRAAEASRPENILWVLTCWTSWRNVTKDLLINNISQVMKIVFQGASFPLS